MSEQNEAVVPATDLIEAVAENKATEVKEEIREEVAEIVEEAKTEAVIAANEIAAEVDERAYQRDENLWNQVTELESRITKLEASQSNPSLAESVTQPVTETVQAAGQVAEIPVNAVEEVVTPPKKKKGFSLF